LWLKSSFNIQFQVYDDFNVCEDAVTICLVISLLEVPEFVHKFCSCMLVPVFKRVHNLA